MDTAVDTQQSTCVYLQRVNVRARMSACLCSCSLSCMLCVCTGLDLGVNVSPACTRVRVAVNLGTELHHRGATPSPADQRAAWLPSLCCDLSLQRSRVAFPQPGPHALGTPSQARCKGAQNGDPTAQGGLCAKASKATEVQLSL